MHISKFALWCVLVLSLSVSHATQLNTNTTTQYKKLTARQKSEVDCLAKNIYYEAGFEQRSGWSAVGAVTLNRVATGNYAPTVCGVVHQKTGSIYQFSWVGMKRKLSKINSDVYTEIHKLATHMYFTHTPATDITRGSTYFHAASTNPKWKLQRVKQIGQHIFYRSNTDHAALKR